MNPTNRTISALLVALLALALLTASLVRADEAQAATCAVGVSAPTYVKLGTPLRIKVFTNKLPSRADGFWQKRYTAYSGNLWIPSGGVTQVNGVWQTTLRSTALQVRGSYYWQIKVKYAGCDTRTIRRDFTVGY